MSDKSKQTNLEESELYKFSDSILEQFALTAGCERHFLYAIRAFVLEHAKEFVDFLYESQIYKDQDEVRKMAMTIMDWLSHKCGLEDEWNDKPNN